MDAWLSPMLCESADEIPTGDEWVIERKLDGWRAVVHRRPDGVRLYGGRNTANYTGRVPYIEEVLQRLPDDTAVDGELIAPAGWGSVQGVMTRTSTGPHVPSDASPPLMYVVFDVLRVAGTDVRGLPWSKRRELLEGAGLNGPLVKTSEAVEADPRTHELWLAEGFEGSVAKRIDSKYRPGKSRSWIKVKLTRTAEAQVTKCLPGKPGELAGTLGALELRMEGSHVTAKVGTGFTRALRDEIWANQSAWVGSIVEIRFQELSATGVPRFPRFVRRRDDKAPAPKPKRPASTGGGSNGSRPRNYKAMGDEKLLDVLAQLEGGYGEATDRAENRHTGLDNELRLCREAAKAKGLR